MDEAFKSTLKRTWRRRRAYNTAMFWLCCSEFRKLEVHSLEKTTRDSRTSLSTATTQWRYNDLSAWSCSINVCVIHDRVWSFLAWKLARMLEQSIVRSKSLCLAACFRDSKWPWAYKLKLKRKRKKHNKTRKQKKKKRSNKKTIWPSVKLQIKDEGKLYN